MFYHTWTIQILRLHHVWIIRARYCIIHPQFHGNILSLEHHLLWFSLFPKLTALKIAALNIDNYTHYYTSYLRNIVQINKYSKMILLLSVVVRVLPLRRILLIFFLLWTQWRYCLRNHFLKYWQRTLITLFHMRLVLANLFL